MPYLARVTICCDANGVHARPSAWLEKVIRGRDVAVEFRRGEGCVCIRPELAMIDIMQAAADLGLESGATFEVACDGPHAGEVFEALRERFTTGYFEGSEFAPQELPGGSEHG